MPYNQETDPTNTKLLYEYVRRTNFGKADFVKDYDTFVDYLSSSPERPRILFEQLTGRKQFNSTFGNTYADFEKNAFGAPPVVEPLQTANVEEDSYETADIETAPPVEVDIDINKLPDYESESFWEFGGNVLTGIWEAVKLPFKAAAEVNFNPTMLPLSPSLQSFSGALREAVAPIGSEKLSDEITAGEKEQIAAWKKAIESHPEYQDKNSDFRKAIDSGSGFLYETVNDQYGLVEKIAFNTANVFTFGLPQHMATEGGELSLIKDPKLKNAVYQLAQIKQNYADSWLERIALQGSQVLAVSMQLVSGKGGFGKGLQGGKLLPGTKLSRDLTSKILEGERFATNAEKLKLLRDAGFTEKQIEKIGRVSVKETERVFKEGNAAFFKTARKEKFLVPEALEVPEAGARWGLRRARLNSYGWQSIKASLPRINTEMSHEAHLMELNGEDPNPAWYITRLGGKMTQAYLEALGEFGGSMWAPYIDGALSKTISNQITRKLVSHAIANPISESLEERITDVFQKYIPNLLAGQPIEDMSTFAERMRDEFITFAPLMLTGAYADIKQEYLQARYLDKKSPDDKSPFDPKSEARRVAINKIRQEAINGIVKELNDITADKNLSEEDKAYLGELKQVTFPFLVETLASDEVRDELAGKIVQGLKDEEAEAEGKISTSVNLAKDDIKKAGVLIGQSEYGEPIIAVLDEALTDIENGDYDIAAEKIAELNRAVHNNETPIKAEEKRRLEIKTTLNAVQTNLSLANQVEQPKGYDILNIEEFKSFAKAHPDVELTDEEQKLFFVSRNPVFSEELRNYAAHQFWSKVYNKIAESNKPLDLAQKSAEQRNAGKIKSKLGSIKAGVNALRQFIPKDVVDAVNKAVDEGKTDLPEIKLAGGAQTNLAKQLLSDVEALKKLKAEDTAPRTKLPKEFKDDKIAQNLALMLEEKDKDAKKSFVALIGAKTLMLELLNRGVSEKAIADLAPNVYDIFWQKFKDQTRKDFELQEVMDMKVSEDDKVQRVGPFTNAFVNVTGVDVNEEQNKPMVLAENDGYYIDIDTNTPGIFKTFFDKLGFWMYTINENKISVYAGSYDNMEKIENDLQRWFGKNYIKSKKRRFRYDRLTEETELSKEDRQKWFDNLGVYFKGNYKVKKETADKKFWETIDKLSAKKLKQRLSYLRYHFYQVRGNENNLGAMLYKVLRKYPASGNKEAMRKWKEEADRVIKMAEGKMDKSSDIRKKTPVPNESQLKREKRDDKVGKTTNLDETSAVKNFVEQYGKKFAEAAAPENRSKRRSVARRVYQELPEKVREAIVDELLKIEGFDSEDFMANQSLIIEWEKGIKGKGKPATTTSTSNKVKSKNAIKKETGQKKTESKADLDERFEKRFGTKKGADGTQVHAQQNPPKETPKQKVDIQDDIDPNEIRDKIRARRAGKGKDPITNSKPDELPGWTSVTPSKGGDFGTPVREQLQDIFEDDRQHFSLGEFIEKVKPKNKWQEFLHKIFLEQIYKIPVISQDLVTYPKKFTGGVYISTENMKQIPENELQILRDAGYDLSNGIIMYNPDFNTTRPIENTLYHEGVHALTVGLINEKYSGRIIELMNAVLPHMDMNDVLIKYAFYGDGTELNPKEFIAMLFGETGGKLRSALERIELKEKQTALQYIISKLSDMLAEHLGIDIKDKTAYAEATRIFNDILTERFASFTAQSVPAEEGPVGEPINPIGKPVYNAIAKKEYDENKALEYYTGIADRLEKNLSFTEIEEIAKQLMFDIDPATGEEIFNLEGLGAVEMLIQDFGIIPEPVGNEARLETVLESGVAIAGIPIQTVTDLLLYFNYKLTGKVPEKPKVETPADNHIEAAETNNYKSDTDRLTETLTDKIDKVVSPDIADILTDSILIIKELSGLLSIVHKDPQLKNLYNYVKRPGMTLKKFQDLFKHPDVHKVFHDLWRRRYRILSYDEWIDLSSIKIYNSLKNKDFKPHLNIVYKIKTENNKVSIESMKFIEHLGTTFSDTDGRKQNTLMEDSMLEEYVKLPAFRKLFGNLVVTYINGFVNLNEPLRRPKGLSSTGRLQDLLPAVATRFWNKNYIFLANYADKNEMPVFKFNPKEIDTEAILKIYNAYAKATGADVNSVTEAEKVIIVLEHMIQEAKLNANLEAIASADVTTSKVLAELNKGGVFNPQNIFGIMKRVFYVLKQKIGSFEGLAEEFGITNSEATTAIPGMVQQKGDITFNHVTIATDSLLKPTILDENGERVPNPQYDAAITVGGQTYLLRDLLFNDYGTEISDGLSLALLGKKSFFDFYRKAFGEYKAGSIKQFAASKPGQVPFYLKHSIQGVSTQDILGQWMLENGITVLSFESSNKLSKPEQLTTLQELQEKKPKIRQISVKNMSHDLMKGEIQDRVKAVRQLISSTFLSNSNDTLNNAPLLNRIFEQMMLRNMDDKFNTMLTYINDYDAIYKYFQDKLVQPQGILDAGFVSAFKSLKGITKNEFVSKYEMMLMHPYFAQYIEQMFLNDLQAIFNIELPKGSALTLGFDGGILTASRQKAAESQYIKGDEALRNKVFRADGRLKEGYCYITKDYAEEKGITVGDTVVHTMVPTDSFLAINTSIVVGILDEDISEKGKIILNSEYVQSLIGRDFDIDVMYVFGYDKNLMTQEQWNQFTSEIGQTQTKLRESIVKTGREILNTPEAKNKLKLATDKSILDIETILAEPAAALPFIMKKSVQRIIMEQLFGEANTNLNSFDRRFWEIKRAYTKGNIGEEVSNRTYYTINSSIGLNITLNINIPGGKKLKIPLNPNHDKKHWSYLKHQISTNDRVDAPNRENIFYYKYDRVKDFLQDYLGYEEADKFIAENSDANGEFMYEPIISMIEDVNGLLWGNLVMLTKAGEPKSSYMERNYGNYKQRIEEQQQIIGFLKRRDFNALASKLRQMDMRNHQYVKSGVVTTRSRYTKQMLLRNAVIDAYVRGLSEGQYNINDNSLLTMTERLPIKELSDYSINRREYVTVENTMMQNILAQYNALPIHPTTGKIVTAAQAIETKINNIPGYIYLLEKYDLVRDKYNKYLKGKKDQKEIDAILDSLQFTLPNIRYAVNAIYHFQRDIDLNVNEATKYSSARGRVITYMLRELFAHPEVFWTPETQKRIDNGEDVWLKPFEYDKEKITMGADAETSRLKFQYKGKIFSQYQINGQEETPAINIKERDELRVALLGENTIFRDLGVRKEMNKLFSFAKTEFDDGRSIPENVDRLEKVRVAIAYLKDALYKKDENGNYIHTPEDREVFWATLLGNFTNEFSIRNFLQQSQPTKYNMTVPKRFGELYRPDYSEILKRRNIDYEFQRYFLYVVGEVDPSFAEKYIDQWNQIASAMGLRTPQSIGNKTQYGDELPAIIENNPYLDDTDSETNFKRFISYYTNKYRRSLTKQNNVKTIATFFGKLISSPEEAFNFLNDYLKDITLIDGLRRYNPLGIDSILRDLTKLSYEQFQEKYQDIPIMYDQLTFVDNLLKSYNLRVDSGKIKGSRIRRKLLGIFMTLNAIRDSYLPPSPMVQALGLTKAKRRFLRYWNNLEAFAIKNETKIYLGEDKDMVLGVLPALMDVNYPGRSYRWRDVAAYIYEYAGTVYEEPFGLVNEAGYRMFHVNASIREVEYNINLYLDRVAGIERKTRNEVEKSFGEDFSDYFKTRVYDIAEKNPYRIKLKKEDGVVYAIVGGVKEVLYTSGGVGIAIRPELLEKIVPNSGNEKTDTLERGMLEAALEIRTLFSIQVPAILESTYDHLTRAYEKLLETGHTDLAKQLDKKRTEYLRFYTDITTKRVDTYVPRIWDKHVFRQAFMENNIDNAVRTLKEVRDSDWEYAKRRGMPKKQFEQLKGKTDEELRVIAEQDLNGMLGMITENGFGIAFNPNAKMRRLPDTMPGYKKDIYLSVNTYVNNFKTMLHNDMIDIEQALFNMKARVSKEDPYIIDTVNRWYSQQASTKDLATKVMDRRGLKTGWEVKFIVEGEDGDDVTIFGKIKEVHRDGITLYDYAESKRYSWDDIYIRDNWGNKIQDKVQRHKRASVVEWLGQVAREQEGLRQGQYWLAKVFHNMLKYPAQTLNYMLTLSNLGFVGQGASTLINLIGGTMLNLDGSWIRNWKFIRKGAKEFPDPEMLHQVMVKLGLETPKYLLDLASFTDLNVNKLGINEDWWKTMKSMFKDMKDYAWEDLKISRAPDAIYRIKMADLADKYKKTGDQQFRKQMYQLSKEYTTAQYIAGEIDKGEHDRFSRKLDEVYKTKSEALPVNPDFYKDPAFWRQFGDILKFSKDKYTSSWLGMKIFQSPEKMLRKHAFFVGYYQAKKVLQIQDEKLAVEYGLANVYRKQKFYGEADRQFGSNTALGHVLFKFSQFVWTEVTRERKNIAAALKGMAVYGNAFNVLANDFSEELDGRKVKVANNVPKYYMTAFAISALLSELAKLFTGWDNPLSPIKVFQYRLYKNLVDLVGDYMDEKDVTAKWTKMDYEEIRFIREMMSALGFGVGWSLPIQLGIWLKGETRDEERFPFTPRAYSNVGRMADIVGYVTGPEEGDWWENYLAERKFFMDMERTATGMNTVTPPITEEKHLWDATLPDKIKELWNYPSDYIPVVRDYERITNFFR